jgi:PhnB protein
MSTARSRGNNLVSAFLLVEDVEKELGFVQAVFDAEIRGQQRTPEGGTWQGEARIGGAIVLVRRASKEQPAATCMLHVWVDDVDASYRTALTQGAKSVSEPQDRAYGNREAAIRDPQGNTWWMARQIHRLSSREVERKLAAQRRERM